MKEYKVIWGGPQWLTTRPSQLAKELWRPILQCNGPDRGIYITLERDVPNPHPYRTPAPPENLP